MSPAVSNLARTTFHACLAWSLARAAAAQENTEGRTGEMGIPALDEAVRQSVDDKKYLASNDVKFEAVIQTIRKA